MFGRTTPSEISYLFDCIDAVERRFAPEFSITRISRQGELALTIADACGNELMYVGVVYDLWLKIRAPLWFGVKKTWNAEVIQRFCRLNDGRYSSYEDLILCPLGGYPTEPEHQTGAVLTMLDEQLRQLQEHSAR